MLMGKAVRATTKTIDEVSSFPSVRLGVVSPKQFLWRFADELSLVMAVFLFLILGQIALSHSNFDNSLLAKLVLKNPDSNPGLYYTLLSTTKESSVASLVPQAFAEETLVAPSSQDQNTQTSLTSIDESGLKAFLPDSLEPFRNAQIQFYTTVSGDTLATVAKKRGISTNTIKWANNLRSTTLKPGQELVLPQVDGVLVKTDESTSIADIASKFKGDPEIILSYNGLPHPDAFNPGQYLMCPGCVIPENILTPENSQIGVRLTDIPNEAGSTHVFYPGHCTWYVAKKFKVTFSGSARYWIKNAKAAGYTISDTPVMHSAVVTSDRAPYGHVAYVEEVNLDKGTIRISEMNYKGLYILSERELPINGSGIVGYILPKDE